VKEVGICLSHTTGRFCEVLWHVWHRAPRQNENSAGAILFDHGLVKARDLQAVPGGLEDEKKRGRPPGGLSTLLAENAEYALVPRARTLRLNQPSRQTVQFNASARDSNAAVIILAMCRSLLEL
jgi:hypothetical protein